MVEGNKNKSLFPRTFSSTHHCKRGVLYIMEILDGTSEYLLI